MSSIIDALKKSDANRPRKKHGMKMNLNLGTSEARKKSHVWALIGLLIVASAAASWLFKKPAYIWQTSDNPVTTTTVVTTKPSVAKKLTKPEPAQVQTKVQQPQSKKSTITQEPSASATDGQLVNTAEDPTSEATTHLSTDASTDKNIETNTLAVISAPAAGDDNKTLQTTVSKVTPESQAIDEQLSETPMKNKQAINKSVADTKANNANIVPQLFELPYTIRKDLPKLSLSVHIYDPIIENRMAILNGLSVHVGDTIEELLTIKNITQEGVILTVQNRDFIILK